MKSKHPPGQTFEIGEMTDEKCPKCKEGTIQRTVLTPPDKGEAIGCNRCTYSVGESGFSYNPLEVDEGWEPPKPSHPNELYRMCWDIVNELRAVNKVYFVDEIPEEMVEVYDIADMMEVWLLKNGSCGS